MALIGLSLIIASLSFFCYKHPPSTWSFMRWLSHGPGRYGSRNSGVTITLVDEKDSQNDPQNVGSALDLDRKAMPPPPPPLNKSPNMNSKTILEVVRASQAPEAVTPSIGHSLNLDGPPSPIPMSSFPAINSIQRASGGRGPPRLAPTPTLQPPLRSVNSLMPPPPARSPLPNRGSPATSSTSLAPPPTHNAIPTKPRKKVLLTPGHSPLDWALLSNAPGSNLRGLPQGTPYLRVPPSLLRQFTGRKGKDAWTVLGGKVYNISPYVPYHPGGELELLKAAGRDGTRLFAEAHPWVNWENMLEPCLVGVAVAEADISVESQLEEMD